MELIGEAKIGLATGGVPWSRKKLVRLTRVNPTTSLPGGIFGWRT
jgi:hypothetical protein